MKPRRLNLPNVITAAERIGLPPEERSVMRIVLGFVILGNGANLALLVAGGPPGTPPLLSFTSDDYSDPLPQAMVLTAIVITFGITALLLAIAYRSWLTFGQDVVQDDPEARRIRDEVAP
jgi:multicomponent Na+:H+ antiporter subunit C